MSVENKIIIGGATQPSTINTPSDVRDRVATFEDIFKIDNPAKGSGVVWVEDEEREYRIISLKSKVIGGKEIANAAVGEVVPESEIISRSLASNEEATKNMAAAIAENKEAVESISEAIAKKATYDEESGVLTLM